MHTKVKSDRRFDTRFNKIIPVVVASDIFGDSDAVARNLSAGGMFVEMSDPLPLGAMVVVHFQIPDSHDALAVRAEVKHHYSFNYSVGDRPAFTRGIGLRFLEFLSDTEPEAESNYRRRVLH
jgi:hypothetical protein